MVQFPQQIISLPVDSNSPYGDSCAQAKDIKFPKIFDRIKQILIFIKYFLHILRLFNVTSSYNWVVDPKYFQALWAIPLNKFDVMYGHMHGAPKVLCMKILLSIWIKSEQENIGEGWLSIYDLIQTNSHSFKQYIISTDSE